MLVYDYALTCQHQSKEVRCSRIGAINFGHRSSGNTLAQNITLKNLNPKSLQINLSQLSKSASKVGIAATMRLSRPFPSDPTFRVSSGPKGRLQFPLKTGHTINLTIELELKGEPIAGIVSLYI